MYVFGLVIKSQTASFRNPEFQNYHKTLDLPPPTTLIGLAGAALGLPPMLAQAFFEDNLFIAGVTGFWKGRVNDIWKYNRLTKNLHVYTSGNSGHSGIVKREILVHNEFVVVFGSGKLDAVHRLEAAFQSPAFALTMGNSDALAKIESIHQNLQIIGARRIKHCLVPGDIVGEVMQEASSSLEFSIYQYSEPITYDLPTRFEYTSEYGKRTVRDIATFSMVNQEMTTNFDVVGVQVNDWFVPIFNL